MVLLANNLDKWDTKTTEAALITTLTSSSSLSPPWSYWLKE